MDQNENYNNAVKCLDTAIFWARCAKIRLGQNDMEAVHYSIRNSRQNLRLGFRYSQRYIFDTIFPIEESTHD